MQHWNDKNAILALHSVGMACRRTLKTRCRVEDLLPGRFLQEDYIFPMPRHRWRWSENQGENLSSPPRLNDETELGVISRSERALAFAIQADGLSWMGSRRIPLPKTQDIMRNQVHNQGAITLWMRRCARIVTIILRFGNKFQETRPTIKFLYLRSTRIQAASRRRFGPPQTNYQHIRNLYFAYFFKAAALHRRIS